MVELPPELASALNRIANAKRVNNRFRMCVEQANRLMAGLDPAQYMGLAREIRQTAKLWPYRPTTVLSAKFSVTTPKTVAKVPEIAWVFLFHGSGKFREVALKHLPDVAPSAFHFHSLAYRLNDWAEPVRRAAHEAIHRLDVEASGPAVADAALQLWIDASRWGRGTPEVLFSVLRQPSVTAEAVHQFRSERTSKGLAAMRQMLRFDDLDHALPDLARSARAPAIRRLALTTLARGEARILRGYRRVWVDKSLGQTRREPDFETRPLTVEVDADKLCLAALEDPAIHVRAAALDMLMERDRTDLVSAEKLGEFADSDIYRLAWRADFIRRHRAGT